MRIFAFLVFLSLVAVGCGSDANKSETEEVKQESESPERTTRREIRAQDELQAQRQRTRTVDPAKDIPRIQPQLQSEEGAHGLTMIVDGTSPQAFQESLELIASESTAAQYGELDAALRYLKAYSPEAWRGVENLYKTLDGMTGEEIIDRARQRREERTTRRN